MDYYIPISKFFWKLNGCRPRHQTLFQSDSELGARSSHTTSWAKSNEEFFFLLIFDGTGKWRRRKLAERTTPARLAVLAPCVNPLRFGAPPASMRTQLKSTRPLPPVSFSQTKAGSAKGPDCAIGAGRLPLLVPARLGLPLKSGSWLLLVVLCIEKLRNWAKLRKRGETAGLSNDRYV